MRALIYITVRSLANRVRTRLRKPLTYVSIVCILLYLLMMFRSFNIIFSDMGMGGPEGYALILSFFIVWSIPVNLLTYARKRGLAFKHSDVHLVFSAPIDPKLILIYAQSKTLPVSLILNLLVAAGGAFWFHVPVLKVVAFFMVTYLVENIVEGSLMLLVFGNEFLGNRGTKVLQGAVWACIAAMILLLLSQLFTQPLSFGLIGSALCHPLLQLIPLIGWNIAFVRLLLIGPDMINVAGSLLYLATAVAAPLIVWRMKCTGQYFEDAMTFADEYEEALKRKKSGSAETSGRKKKYKKAQIVYRGGGARAIYYRQLLEYKKSRFFLLNYMSFVMLAISVTTVVCIVMQVFSFSDLNMGEGVVFLLPGLSAYLSLIFSSITPKWTKELSNPYTFLLPDTSLRKLWYSTLLEHIKALVDGMLLCVPIGFVMGLSPIRILLCVVVYVCLQANRLYTSMVCDGILKPLFGSVGLSFVRMGIQGGIMVLGILGAGIGTAAAGVEAGFLILILIAVACAGLMALLASILFGRMESLDNY